VICTTCGTENLAGARFCVECATPWRSLGLAFDEALAGLDVASLLNPTEREMPEAAAVIEAAQATFAQLGARPFAARLETAGVAS
jgi:zinc-ribbon domain